MKNYFYLFTLFFLTACGLFSGKEGDKSFADRLNGNNYEEGSGGFILNPLVSGPAVDIFKARKTRNSTIAGRAVFVSDGMEYPIKGEMLVLKRDNKEVFRHPTNIDGYFNIIGQFTDGKYDLEILSEKYQGSLGVELKGYLLENIMFVATTKLLRKTE